MKKDRRDTSDLPSGHIVVIPEEDLTIHLKDRWLAAFLAWLIPGLGHLYQGRTAKGILFMVCILGTFLYGLFALGGGKVVYASTSDQPLRWQYWCQLGTGLPALPALVQRSRFQNNKEVLFANASPPFDRLMAPPRPVEMVVDPKTQRQYPRAFTSKDGQNQVVRHPDELAKWNHDLHHYYDLGTVYTMIAGLLNVLVVYDACCGPLVLLPEPRKKKKKKQATPDGASPGEEKPDQSS